MAIKPKSNKFLPDFEKDSIYSFRLEQLEEWLVENGYEGYRCLLYTSPSPRDRG